MRKRLDDLEGATESCQAALPIFREIRDRLGEANVLMTLGDLEARGDNVNAAESYRKAAEYARTHEGFDPDLIEDFLASARRLESS